ncbi:MAG: hypothetical protein HQ518_12520 [Rhodopirellula sp.]|nr:hypothetical protein [Rhodopirellula sp.]
MSLHESQRYDAQSFVSKVWSYDDGKARKRAVKVAIVTILGVAPLIVRHLLRFDLVAYEQHWPGFPHYHPGTVFLGGCVAVFSNAVTAYFTTSELRRRVCRTVVYGACFAVVSPCIQVWLLMGIENSYRRLYLTPENLDNRLATYLWFPMVIGTLFGAAIARTNDARILCPRRMSSDVGYVPAAVVGCLLTLYVVACFLLPMLLVLEGVGVVLGW